MRKLFLWMLMFVAPYTAVAEVNPELMIYKIKEECRGFADVITRAKWTYVSGKIKASGKSVGSGVYESLRAVQFEQCVVANQMQILKSLRDTVPPDEWRKVDGDKTLEELSVRLQNTVGQPGGF